MSVSSPRLTAALPLLALLLALLPTVAVADPGDLLTSFGTDGIALGGLGQHQPVQDAILHPDHGLLIATYDSQGSNQAKIRLVQMDPETGVVLGTITLDPLVDEQSELHLEDDGQGGVIVGGTVVVSANDLDVLIFRLTSGLVIDPGFGLRQVGFNLDPANGYDLLQDLEVLSDGRIVALASVPTTQGFEGGLVFLHSDGTPDTTVTGGGLPDGAAFVPFLVEGDVYPKAMEEDSLGRIWIAAARVGPTSEKMAVARILSNASADVTFAGNGSTLLEYRDCALCPVENADLQDMAVLNHQAYIAVETRDSMNNYDIGAVARLTDLGGTDSSFGGWRGIDFVPPGVGTTYSARPDLVADPYRPGVVVVMETEIPGGGDYLGIARLGLDGEPDPGFGAGEPMLLSFGPGDPFVSKPRLMVQNIDSSGGSLSSLRIAAGQAVAQDVAVMALEGFSVDLFGDGFESGDLSAWSASTP